MSDFHIWPLGPHAKPEPDASRCGGCPTLERYRNALAMISRTSRDEDSVEYAVRALDPQKNEGGERV